MQDVDSVIKGSAVLHEVINTIDKHECSNKWSRDDYYSL